MIKYIKSLMLIVLSAGILTTSAVYIDRANAQTPAPVKQQQVQASAQSALIKVEPLVVVNNPTNYLNKNVQMKAKFDKFSTLGLDYKPAYKSSEDYISFLIKRDDTTFDIPLSEMKLFLKRETAEKFIDLKTNDEIDIKGLVFSDALGDTWVDVKEIVVTQKAPESEEKK